MKTKISEATLEEYTTFKLKYGYPPKVIRYLTFKPKTKSIQLVKTAEDVIEEVIIDEVLI